MPMAWGARAMRLLPRQAVRQTIFPRSRASIIRQSPSYRTISQHTWQASRRAPLSSYRSLLQQQHSALSRRIRNVRKSSNKPSPDPTSSLGSPEPTTLSQRMRKLSREYGWSALGVYFMLSALDFPFCFLAVRLLGTERIGQWEHAVVSTFWRLIEVPFPNIRKVSDKATETAQDVVGDPAAREGTGWGVEEAEAANKSEQASIWTQLALAYAIHKSFIFIRVPLTAAVTPKVVKTLRGWGWNIGKRKPKVKSIGGNDVSQV